ncbi:hypothetical protein L6452_36352 [Arctium lappa]|uniref:Uncharacterized protein n=1 Tax=Arctium lappa TaxID=4217 RepID=A0ACB8YA88_ARCLA|nr:hypothetical protein L6452_36352 [Arctium lappa]
MRLKDEPTLVGDQRWKQWRRRRRMVEIKAATVAGGSSDRGCWRRRRPPKLWWSDGNTVVVTTIASMAISTREIIHARVLEKNGVARRTAHVQEF